jgi:RHS repeat-associated protein
MTRDPNKGIDIDYNFLNLPELITFGTGEEIEIIYDAMGSKLQKIASKNGIETVKDYVGGIEYVTENATSILEAIYHEEGRVIPIYDTSGSIDSVQYEYSIKDHLGNSRITFSDLDGNGKLTIGGDNSEILQENHYYPFGMNMEGNWVPQIGLKNQYLYNGKELNEELGLNWLDYGARWYDPAIARWGQIDPLADSYAPFSPYNYTLNNPIRFIDPDGMAAKDPPTIRQAIWKGMESKRFRKLMTAIGLTDKTLKEGKITFGNKTGIIPGKSRMTIKAGQSLDKMVFDITMERTNIINEEEFKGIIDDTKALKNTPEEHADKLLAVEAEGIVNKAIVANEIEGMEPEKGVAKQAKAVKEGKLSEKEFTGMVKRGYG